MVGNTPLLYYGGKTSQPSALYRTFNSKSLSPFPPNSPPRYHRGEVTDRWFGVAVDHRLFEEKNVSLIHRSMKPHLDSRSNFNRYQHNGATVTVDRSFV